MSSSTEPAVTELVTPQLATGAWTRLGDKAVLGDAVTEQILGSLAESTRAAARAQGYAVGWAEGRRAAEEAAASVAHLVAAESAESERRRKLEHESAVAALQAAAAALSAAVDEACARVDQQATEVAIALTEVILAESVTACGDTAALAVRRSLAAGRDAGSPLVRVYLSPEDAATATLSGTDALVVPDARLERGDALVELETHLLDLRVQPALDRVRSALRGEQS